MRRHGSMELEARFTDGPQGSVTLSERSGGGKIITGYAAVFYKPGDRGTEYVMAPDIVERIRPGAFDRALRERQDVIACFNHEDHLLLGRTSAGTLRLSVDSTGLKYEIDTPDNSVGKDVAEWLKRGDVRGSSFRFAVAPGGAEWDDGPDVSIRWLNDLYLADVGPVTWPAYQGTSAGVRGNAAIGTDADAVAARLRELAEHDRRQRDADAVEVALRLVAIGADD